MCSFLPLLFFLLSNNALSHAGASQSRLPVIFFPGFPSLVLLNSFSSFFSLPIPPGFLFFFFLLLPHFFPSDVNSGWFLILPNWLHFAALFFHYPVCYVSDFRGQSNRCMARRVRKAGELFSRFFFTPQSICVCHLLLLLLRYFSSYVPPSLSLPPSFWHEPDSNRIDFLAALSAEIKTSIRCLVTWQKIK